MMARVLVVDDEDDIRLLIRVTLQRAGAEVEEAATAQEGLHSLLSADPDLVVLDIRLPDGDGFDILEHMRETGQLERVPVVIVSAHSTPTTRRRALDQGASRYVTKPFTGPELMDAVERALAS